MAAAAPPLWAAAITNDVEKVAELLACGDAGIDALWRDPAASTYRISFCAAAKGSSSHIDGPVELAHACMAVHAAAAHGAVAALAAQLDAHPALVHARDEVQRTPLMHAAANGHPAAVQLLLARGADAAAVGEAGETSLHLAAAFGHVETCALLQHAHDCSGVKDTPSHWAGPPRTPVECAIACNRPDVVGLLMAREPHLPASIIADWIRACFAGDAVTCDSILARDGEALRSTKALTVGVHALVANSERKSCDILSMFTAVMEHAAALGATLSTKVCSEAIIGTYCNSTAFTALMLKMGADVHYETSSGSVMLSSAHNLDAIKLLVVAGGDVRRPHRISSKTLLGEVLRGTTLGVSDADVEATAAFLLDHGALDREDVAAFNERLVNEKANLAWSILMSALDYAPDSLLRRIMALGFDLNARPWTDGETILFKALVSRPSRVLRMMQSGVDITARNASGRTALHACVIGDWGETAAIEILMKAGADPSLMDVRGRTMLEAKFRRHAIEIAARMVKVGVLAGLREDPLRAAGFLPFLVECATALLEAWEDEWGTSSDASTGGFEDGHSDGQMSDAAAVDEPQADGEQDAAAPHEEEDGGRHRMPLSTGRTPERRDLYARTDVVLVSRVLREWAWRRRVHLVWNAQRGGKH